MSKAIQIQDWHKASFCYRIEFISQFMYHNGLIDVKCNAGYSVSRL